MNDAISDFQDGLGRIFRDLMLGVAASEAGMSFIKNNQQGFVSLNLAGGSQSEPIQLAELAQNELSVKEGVAELFQSKAVALWGDLLNEIFNFALNQHLSGEKSWRVFKSFEARFDFESDISPVDQIRDSVKKRFAFYSHKDKIAAISKIFPLEELADKISIIKKHVEIRNAFQHHNGRMHDSGLRILGLQSFSVKGHGGDDYRVGAGDKISLSIIEMDVLRSVLFEVSSSMEAHLE
ncbi:hypothetical protein AYO08_14725 [Pseudomonas putida]|uniref:hypothetical protein n=1 Tax=Pseudomonas putida TaxID=303 RepID=UPI0007DC2C05|nr:hypothetical protein [Pseudomonas putida]OAS04608.1 hypothetical protein AYO08_14725 [Pseudomonas putida]